MLDIIVPEDIQLRFRNQHGRVAQNVFYVIDFDMKFIFNYTVCERTVHDARLFLDALSWPRN